MFASVGQKPQFGANFDIWGHLYRPRLPMRAKFSVLEQTDGIRFLRAKFHVDQFILSPSGGEKLKILPFRHFVVSPVGDTTKGLWESWTQMHNYKPSRIERHQNRFRFPTPSWWNLVQQKTRNVFGCPGGGWNPSPIKLGMVIEDFKHVLAPPKLLGSNA